MEDFIDGKKPIYRCKMDHKRFNLTKKAAMSQDMAEEYAVCADMEANGGLIVYARYGKDWHVNPWSTRFLIRDLLEKVGIDVSGNAIMAP